MPGEPLEAKVLVGIPWGMPVHDPYQFWSFMRLAAQGWSFIENERDRTDVHRNQFARTLLDSDADYLIMLDQDHRHPENTLQVLVSDAVQTGYPIIAGLNFRRRPPYDPLVWGIHEGQRVQIARWGKGLIGPVWSTGYAAAIFHRSVFETLPYPWFKYDYPDPATYGNPRPFPGEDQWFSALCREYDVPMYVDTRIVSPHEPNLPGWVDEKWWEAHMESDAATAASIRPTRPRMKVEVPA